ncbi:Zinc finger MYND domain-containing protein 12 [Boothiomyces sp. JEL0866]|nr:Zinc finger MYND domain-containing protein 12 [Boothiomyces sp. JEL0866]
MALSLKEGKLEYVEINPLSNPKGVKRLCEICEKPAYRQCKNCRMELLRISKQQSYRYLFEGQYELAIPAALQSLRFSMAVSGDNPIDLVPSYLILGEASIGIFHFILGMKRHYEAENYLSLAKWAILKSEDCANDIKSQLHRNFGQLYAAQGQYDKALHQLALDITCITMHTNNPEDVAVSGGYYHMGIIFQKQGRNEDAIAFYDIVVSIWSKVWTPSFKLDIAQAAEAIQMISSIHKFRQQTTEPTSSAVRTSSFTLAKMYFSAGQYDRAKEQGFKALEAFEAALGREHSATIEVRTFLKSAASLAPMITQRKHRGSFGSGTAAPV